MFTISKLQFITLGLAHALVLLGDIIETLSGFASGELLASALRLSAALFGYL